MEEKQPGIGDIVFFSLAGAWVIPPVGKISTIDYARHPTGTRLLIRFFRALVFRGKKYQLCQSETSKWFRGNVVDYETIFWERSEWNKTYPRGQPA